MTRTKPSSLTTVTASDYSSYLVKNESNVMRTNRDSFRGQGDASIVNQLLLSAIMPGDRSIGSWGEAYARRLV